MTPEEIKEKRFESLEPEGASLEAWYSFSPPAHMGRTPDRDMTLQEFLETPVRDRPAAWTNIEVDMVKLVEEGGYTVEYSANNGSGWHNYAMTYDGRTGFVTRYIDGVVVTKRQWRRMGMPAMGLVSGGRVREWRSHLRRNLHGYKVKTKRAKK